MQVLSSKISDEMSPTKTSLHGMIATDKHSVNENSSHKVPPLVKIVNEHDQMQELNKQVEELANTHVSLNAKLA